MKTVSWSQILERLDAALDLCRGLGLGDQVDVDSSRFPLETGRHDPTLTIIEKLAKALKAESVQQVCGEVLVAVWRLEVKQGKERQGRAYKFTSDDKAIDLYFTELGSSPRIDSWYREVDFFCLPDTVDPRGPKGSK